MADITTMKLVTLEKLALYHENITSYIDAADAKSIKTVAIDGNVLKFYKVEEPLGETAPAYEITLPETDLSNLLEKFEAATAGHVVTVAEDGKTIADSGVSLNDLATKEEVEIVDGKVAENAQAITNLDAKVGDIPVVEGQETPATVIEYINKKTEGIATDAALGELQTAVNELSQNVKEISDDYLTSVDEQELIDAIAEEKGRAEGIEAGLRTDVDAIKNDYLKKSDKEELQGNIDEVASAVELLTNGVSAEEVDGVNDLIQYVKDHGTEVTGIKEDIADNAKAIEDEIQRATEKEAEILVEVGKKVDQTAYDTKVQELADADAGLAERLTTVEDLLGDGEGSVTDKIADALADAKQDASDKDAALKEEIETAYKKYTDDAVASDRERIAELEKDTHTHANADELAKVVDGDVAKWNQAAEQSHEHANKAELDKIAEGDKAKWDAMEANAAADATAKVDKALEDAKTDAANKDAVVLSEAQKYVDAMNTAMNSRVEATEEATSDHEDRLVALESVKYEEVTVEDIHELFNK